jgi:hypothetical protein
MTNAQWMVSTLRPVVTMSLLHAHLVKPVTASLVASISVMTVTFALLIVGIRGIKVVSLQILLARQAKDATAHRGVSVMMVIYVLKTHLTLSAKFVSSLHYHAV